MARCLVCGISGKNNKPLCWAKYQMCLQCCATAHPEEYPENIVLKGLASQMIKRADRKINLCKVCSGTIKKLAYHANGKRKVLNAGFCTVCAIISVYDPRLKIMEATK